MTGEGHQLRQRGVAVTRADLTLDCRRSSCRWRLSRRERAPCERVHCTAAVGLEENHRRSRGCQAREGAARRGKRGAGGTRLVRCATAGRLSCREWWFGSRRSVRRKLPLARRWYSGTAGTNGRSAMQIGASLTAVARVTPGKRPEPQPTSTSRTASPGQGQTLRPARLYTPHITEIRLTYESGCGSGSLDLWWACMVRRGELVRFSNEREAFLGRLLVKGIEFTAHNVMLPAPIRTPTSQHRAGRKSATRALMWLLAEALAVRGGVR